MLKVMKVIKQLEEDDKPGAGIILFNQKPDPGFKLCLFRQIQKYSIPISAKIYSYKERLC